MLKTLSPRTPSSPGPKSSMETLCELVLREIGEDPSRDGLERTPQRFKKSMLEMTMGYHISPSEAVGEGIFASESSGPVFVRNIEFFSLCEHHLLPFWGHVSIGYLPNERILGLSKLPRVVEVFARRLQVQERLTREIAESIFELIQPRAVVVSMEANHMCMMMRGVRKNDSTTKTEHHVGLDQLGSEERTRLWKGIE